MDNNMEINKKVILPSCANCANVLDQQTNEIKTGYNLKEGEVKVYFNTDTNQTYQCNRCNKLLKQKTT